MHGRINEENAVLLIRSPYPPQFHNLIASAFFVFVLLFLFTPLTRPQEHDMGSMPGMNMGTPTPEDAATLAMRLAWKHESEFNHHLAGFFVILAGIFILAQDYFTKRWAFVRFGWPMCFLAAGLFLLVFSDTEIWPFGPQTPWYAITHNREDLQHKIFSIVLLAIGYVELQRARGRLKAAWAAWFFPVVAASGAILLLFHVHGGDMQAPHAMEAMEHIQRQHRWFAATGMAIALTNGLAGTPQKWQPIFKKAWPALLIVLGILLTQYTE